MKGNKTIEPTTLHKMYLAERSQPLSANEAKSLIADGRGWDNKDRNSTYDKMKDQELVERLGSWSPIVRERAAAALARRSNPSISAVVSLLDSDSLDARIGACTALEQMRGTAAPAVSRLQQTLKHEDMWLRIRAASALAEIGKPAITALPEMLEMMAREPSSTDPRGMEQRYLAFAIFGKLLTNAKSLEGVDREKLRIAIVKGLQNQDGHARSQVSEIYRNLSYEELAPLLPSVLEAVEKPAPSGEMFADGVRLNGLKVLASHHLEEGMQACVEYLESQNPWSSENRTPEILDVLLGYGANAQKFVPKLEEIAKEFDDGEVDFPEHLSRRKAKAVREAIKKIEASTDRPPLKRI